MHKNVLIVEDRESEVSSIRPALENRGIACVIVSSINEAKTQLTRLSFTVVVLDWTLPSHTKGGINDTEGGMKILKALRTGELGALNMSVPVAVFSKQLGGVNAEEVKKLGGCIGIYPKSRPWPLTKDLISKINETPIE